MREVVKSGYNKGEYDKAYARRGNIPEGFEKSLCDELTCRIKSNSKILDMGCGVGLPYDKYFSDQGLSVTGLDICEKHIEKAKQNVDADFRVGEFFDARGKYDAVVSLYAIFHIPRTEHKKLLEHIYSLLKKDGVILITLGVDSMKCEVGDFAGSSMAWSSYTAEKNKKLVKEAGFQILVAAEDYRKERHLWVLARKSY